MLCPDRIVTLAWFLIDAYDGVVYIDLGCSVLNFERIKKLESVKSIPAKYAVMDQDIFNPNITYFWQYNKQTKEIQKVDLNNLKILANIKLDITYIKGEIVGFTEVRNSNTLIVAAYEKGKYGIYKSLDEKDRFRWFLNVTGVKAVSSPINNINYYQENNSYVLSFNGGEKSIRFQDNSTKGWIDLGGI